MPHIHTKRCETDGCPESAIILMVVMLFILVAPVVILWARGML